MSAALYDFLKEENFLKEVEGFKLKAYKDSTGKPTIGIGSITYKDGTPVKMGDTITLQQAEDLLKWELDNKSSSVHKLLDNTIVNQNQFGALLSFTFNEGVDAFTGSTLLKKIKNNPDDSSIRYEFSRWNKEHVNGALHVSKGLTIRRAKEADLYFS